MRTICKKTTIEDIESALNYFEETGSRKSTCPVCWPNTSDQGKRHCLLCPLSRRINGVAGCMTLFRLFTSKSLYLAISKLKLLPAADFRPKTFNKEAFREIAQETLVRKGE